MEWKKKIQCTYLVKASYEVYIRDSCTSVGKKIKQLKLLTEQRKSKCFEKSEDYTVDERNCKFFLPEQNPVSSWHCFLYFQSAVWWLQFIVYILHSIAMTLHWAMCAKNSPTNYKKLIIAYLILRHLKSKVIFRTFHSTIFYNLFQNLKHVVRSE